jgi:hypothetical protein
MLVGHVALGLGGKKFAPRVSLGTLVIAGLFPDIVWVALVVMGIEHFRVVPGITVMNAYDLYDYSFSHGLLANLVMAALFGGIYFLIKKDRRSAIVLSLVVLSHWVLDLISHRADLPLIGNSGPLVGLGLWNSFWGSIIVEIGLFAIGLDLYISATKTRRTIAFLPLALFILYSAILFIGSLFGKPSEDIFRIGMVFGTMFFILFVLAYWSDAQREAK